MMRRMAMLTGSAMIAAIGFGAALQPSAQGSDPVPQAALPTDTIDELLGSFFSAMSAGPRQARNWDGLRSLFAEQGRMIAARSNADGGADPMVLTVDDYIGANKKYLEAAGLVETEVGRRVEQYGNLAHALSTYESRRSPSDAEPYSRGIYSFQLINSGQGWRIVSVFWDYERPDSPIPERYLTSP